MVAEDITQAYWGVVLAFARSHGVPEVGLLQTPASMSSEPRLYLKRPTHWLRAGRDHQAEKQAAVAISGS